MTSFADSSALVKLYADEPGRESVRRAGYLVVSQVARVEVPAAIWRKHRIGELAAEHARVLTADFEADFFGIGERRPRFAAVAAGGEVFDGAARLCAAHRLRAYDAVQLASAIAARAVLVDCDRLVAFDAPLRDAAAAEGFALLPAELP